MRHLLSINDLTDQELDELTAPGAPAPSAAFPGQTMGMLFEQPSLRTMASFVSASAAMGLTPCAVTTTGDTLRDQCDLVDELVQLSMVTRCVVSRTRAELPASIRTQLQAPLVNAGDGSNEHPTQCLVDVMAMRADGLDGHKVVLMGNLRDHRVHHSLFQALTRLGASVTCVSPPELRLPARYSFGREEHVLTTCSSEVNEAMSAADFVYLTPVKYWNTPELGFNGAFDLNLARASHALKRTARILHPFPRLGELHTDLDGSQFDAYSGQVRLGPTVRRRVLQLLLTSG